MAEPTKAEIRAKAAEDQKELERRSALVKASPQLAPYGTPEQLAEMVKRVKFMVPGGDRLDDNAAYALATAAFVHGLNPIIGECWWIPGSGFMPGIRGLRRLGREQLGAYGATAEIAFKIIEKPKERERYKIPLGALAFKAILRNSKKRRDWVDDAKKLREALGPDAPYDVLLENIGDLPQTIGYGYVTEEQMEEMDNPRWYHKCKVNTEANVHDRSFWKDKKKITWKARELRGPDNCPDCGNKSKAKSNAMPHVQRAQKRSEAHAWKMECDLPFDVHPGEDVLAEMDESALSLEAGALDLEFLPSPSGDEPPTPPEPPSPPIPDEPTEEPPPPDDEGDPQLIEVEAKPVAREWSDEVCKRLRDTQYLPANAAFQHIRNLLNLSPFNPGDPYEWIEEWTGYYYAARGPEKKTPPTEAAPAANQLWKMAHKADEDARGRFGDDWFN